MSNDDLQKLLGDYFDPSQQDGDDREQFPDSNYEKRRFLRRDASWSGYITLDGSPTVETYSVLVSNVSQGGAMIELAESLSESSRITLRFCVEVNDKPHEFNIAATVRYILPQETDPSGSFEHQYRVGISFAEVSASDAQYLECFANYIF